MNIMCFTGYSLARNESSEFAFMHKKKTGDAITTVAVMTTVVAVTMVIGHNQQTNSVLSTQIKRGKNHNKAEFI